MRLKSFTALAFIFSLFTVSISAQDCNVDAGTITTDDPTMFCKSDGEDDIFSLNIEGAVGENQRTVITWDDGEIFFVTQNTSFNLEGVPGNGICLIYRLSWEGEINGLENGANVGDLEGDCFDLSEPLTVVEYFTDGGTITTQDETTFCVDDGEDDLVDVELEGEVGMNSAWVITDADLNILGLPAAPPFNFEGAGEGSCLIWHLSWSGNLEGAAVGENAADLSGDCFDLSNPIEVIREECEDPCIVDGGMLTADGPTTICKSDGEDDIFSLELEGAVGDNQIYVVTWLDGEIILTSTQSSVNLEGIPGNGICLFWSLSWNGEIEGLEPGLNAFDVTGDCFDFSNSIEVTEYFTDGGTITTQDETTFCVDDGEDDLVDVELEGEAGMNSAWVITDADLNILGLPAAPPFNFEGAGEGSCLIWHLSWSGDLEGAAVGENAADLSGDCFDLSNPIEVVREECEEPCIVDGGTISTDSPDVICKSDGEDDIFSLELEGAVGDNQTFVVTWLDGEIILTSDQSSVNLEGIPGNGVCLFWSISWNGEIEGLEPGLNAFDVTGDCFDFSNSIEVTEYFTDGGIISTTDSTTFCVDDGIDDLVDVTLEGEAGMNSAWVITDADLNILGLPAAPPFNFEGAGEGSCLIWHLSWSGDLEGAAVGENAADLSGDCFDLSNPIEVIREECEDPCIVDGGMLSADGPTMICKSDGEDDIFSLSLEGNVGDNQTFVVTWLDGEIILTSDQSSVNLEGIPGNGICLFWSISWNGEINGLEPGLNALDVTGDCFEFSNSIEVTEYYTLGGDIFTTDSTTICVGDGIPNPINVELSGEAGMQSGWVITDDNLNILALPDAPPFDLEGAGTGICLIWHLSWSGDLMGAEVGANAADLSGDCFSLSNSIEVNRVDCSAPVSTQVEWSHELSTSPNPTDGLAVVTYSTNKNARTQISVFNMNGQQVMQLFNEQAVANVKYTFQLNGAHLPNGVYFYQITDGTEVRQEKFIIAR